MKKRLLITGGSGFLGRNLALSLKDEYEVFLGSRNNKQNFLANHITKAEVLPMDVSSMDSVRDIIGFVNPEIVVHAAATKFVDLSEKYPLETIDINILGSRNVARASMEAGVNFVLGISTDKASPPVKNIYGLSKATMEKLFCNLNGQTNTKFACVRYGNVAWSTGSVLPIWKKMHEETGVIKTTGPDMRRFFFTVEEAVSLVKTAISMQDSIQGKILSREMKSAQILDILNVWTENFGGSWERSSDRPGEREDEYLIGESELDFCYSIDIDGIKHFILSPKEKVEVPYATALTSKNAQRLTDVEILKILKSVPDIL